MIASGSLDRRIQFLRAPMVHDGLQNRRGEYVPYCRAVWASKTPVSDGERYRTDTVMRDMSVRFVVRYSSLTTDIALTDRILCEGQRYAIGAIKEIGRREGFEITAGWLAP